MARIDSKTLFLTTSPRTPAKMIPEIALLNEKFSGEEWNHKTQVAFMDLLKEENFFNGKGENDPAFSARDRINRAPKALGFVLVSPVLSLTPAGLSLLSARRKEEVFLRQILKFQIPSPYHKPTAKAAKFCVKPYLEMLRLIRVLGILKFDELQIFGMQLTDWHNFDTIVSKIETFRKVCTESHGNYRSIKNECIKAELKSIYADRIAHGDTRTRESNDKSLDKFLATQANNMRDYADSCFRYLHATGLVNVSHVGKSLSIIQSRIKDVDYILQNVERDPCFIENESQYTAYLGDATIPILLTDNRQHLIKRIQTEFPEVSLTQEESIDKLKEILDTHTEERKESAIQEQVNNLKEYKLYDEIQNTFNLIGTKVLYDEPLMFEWNTWRAMTMLDGGNIKANLNFDDFGHPLSTAQGNMADIICDYGDYMLTVEVTLANGQRQYEMEGEPVSRHLGRLKATCGKPCYCLFVAPTINDACIAHFYALHSMNISYYGGKSVIVPLPLKIFQKMLEDSYKADYTPSPKHVQRFFEHSKELVATCRDEHEWFNEIQKAAVSWL